MVSQALYLQDKFFCYKDRSDHCYCSRKQKQGHKFWREESLGPYREKQRQQNSSWDKHQGQSQAEYYCANGEPGEHPQNMALARSHADSSNLESTFLLQILNGKHGFELGLFNKQNRYTRYCS